MRHLIFPRDEHEGDDQYRQLTERHALGVGKRARWEARHQQCVDQDGCDCDGEEQERVIIFAEAVLNPIPEGECQEGNGMERLVR